MSMEVDVKLLKNLIPGYLTRMAERVAVAVIETAHAIENDVKGGPHSLYSAYPPKPSYDRTGNLGRSYHVLQDRAAYAEGSFVAQVGSDPGIAPYTAFVEYGTSKMPAEPHLVPSTEAQQLPFIERVRAALARF